MLLLNTFLLPIAIAAVVRLDPRANATSSIVAGARTEWLDGAEITLPGRPYSAKEKKDGEDLLGHVKRALPPGKLWGETGVPYYTQVRQFRNTCGLTAAMQAIAWVFPELLKRNIVVDNGPDSVKVLMTDYRVTPLVKRTVVVSKQSMNANNMMDGSVWWPGAFEKGVEGLGISSEWLLASWGMTMITGLEAEAAMTVLTGLPNKLSKDDTWAQLIKGRRTPITIQTWAKSHGHGPLTGNHVYTVLDAGVLDGQRRLRLRNPQGLADERFSFDEVWNQLYIVSWLKGQPTRASMGFDKPPSVQPGAPVVTPPKSSSVQQPAPACTP